MSFTHEVLLYYFYTAIEDVETFRDEHFEFCKENNLLGRIFVAKEGINGTVSGLKEDTKKYMDMMQNHPLFKGIVFKVDEAEGHAFSKLHVRVKKELVNFSLEEDVNPHEITGEYLKPVDFYNALKDPNTVVIDARNTYEYDLGHFRGAIRPEIETFRELPNWIRANKEKFQGKKILTYCTGGIRCEKFSGWLKREGFNDVGQLHGGIVTYGKDEKVKGELWDGALYVFDSRITVPVNRVNPTVVGKDYYTGAPCERYVNCANPECNKQMLMSEETEHKYLRSCCKECMEHPRNRYVIEHKVSFDVVKERLQNYLNI